MKPHMKRLHHINIMTKREYSLRLDQHSTSPRELMKTI
uniref:Uncharacterized protein n=1 Tax=Arundo donax TaxID=35708 RepID=A0A0A9EQR8_ARUDO